MRKAMWIAVVTGLLLAGCSAPGGVGGPEQRAQVVQEAEATIRQARLEQEVLRHREEILRYQLRLLEEEEGRWEFSDVPERRERWRQARMDLLILLRNAQAAELRIRDALDELWGAQERAVAWSSSYRDGRDIRFTLAWPVEEVERVSAAFRDAAYMERFGIPHNGIDIPVLQGTLVRAAADGVVREVSDRGRGYNSLTIVHEGSIVTLYGHVSAFLVAEGQRVRRGDPIARSGGEPGTPGAGLLTTGQHLHFEVVANGEHIDPLVVLPPL